MIVINSFLFSTGVIDKLFPVIEADEVTDKQLSGIDQEIATPLES